MMLDMLWVTSDENGVGIIEAKNRELILQNGMK